MSASLEEFQQSQQLLVAGNPRGALVAARRASRRDASPQAKAALAAILIDASELLGMPSLAREGREILLSLEAKWPPSALGHVHYNVGNAYATIGKFERGVGPGTRASLAEAVSHYDEAAQRLTLPDLRANLANTFLRQGRWVEGLDELDDLLRNHPDHYNALAFRGSALMGMSIWLGDSHAGLLYAALDSYQRAYDLAADDPIAAVGFKRVIDNLRGRLPPAKNLRRRKGSPHSEWIWSQRLALNPCPYCRVENPELFDIYPLPGLLTSSRRRIPTEDVHAILNALILTYSTARWQLCQASLKAEDEFAGHVIQNAGSRTKPANLPIGLLASAATGFYRLLGQIATSMNNCFRLGHAPNRVTFDNVWGKSNQKGFPRSRGEIQPSIRRRATPPIAALYRLAESMDVGLGRYKELRILRNEIEHRLAVFFDDDPIGSSHLYSPVLVASLRRGAFQLGRIAKAALWYFAAAVSMDERQRVKQVRARGFVVCPGKGSTVVRC